MSLLNGFSALSGASALGGSVMGALFLKNRSIGGYIPDVVLEERHEDRLEITEHPIENGANITDHAYKQPAEVEIRVMWRQNYTPVGSFLFGNQIGSKSDVYDGLLRLQRDRTLIDVVTGKRTYKNALIEELRVTTDGDTENALEVRARIKELIIVDTSITKLSSATTRSISKAGNAIAQKSHKALKSAQGGVPSGYIGVTKLP